MKPRITTLPEKILVGKSLRMTLAQNKTPELWGSFMPRLKEVQNKVGTDLYSMQVYNPELNFKDFTPQTEFTKWAGIEVSDVHQLPKGLDTYTIKGGLYAVFIHKGTPSTFPQTMQMIFGQWMPNSEYVLDQREHFELLGEKYKNNDPESEEEVWIPIKLRMEN